MTDDAKPDLCIIGAGPAGLAAAAAARAYGASVVLVERDGLGGTSLFAGSVPAKALIAAGQRAHLMRTAPQFGIAAEEPKMHFGRLNDHIQDVIVGIAPSDAEERLTALGVEVVRAEARFIDKRTLAAGERQIRARRFIIAAGSRPSVPVIEGLGSVPYFTTDSIFDATRKLTHLLVIGAGPAGLEIAQAYRRLGAMVTVIEHKSALQAIDPELSAIALRQLREEGIDIREHTEVRAVHARSLGIGVTVASASAEENLDISHILVTTGRTPSLDSLDLDKARIRRLHGGKGLVLKAGLKTSNPRVYAVGDAAGGLYLSQMARHQAEAVVRNALFSEPARFAPENVPLVIFTDPEIASVGLTEPMARARHRNGYRVLRASFADNDRARTMRQTFGLAKVITDPRGKLLGASIVGPQAGELIALFSFAIANGLSARHLAAFTAPYPALSEIAVRLGQEFFHDARVPAWRSRWLAFNRLFP